MVAVVAEEDEEVLADEVAVILVGVEENVSPVVLSAEVVVIGDEAVFEDEAVVSIEAALVF